MNSSKGLLEGECGQPNALVRVGRQMFQDANAGTARSFLGPLQPSTHIENEFAREYLEQLSGTSRHAPTTFSMRGLLQEVDKLEQSGPSGAAAPNWTREYLDSASAVVPSQEWAQEYLRTDPAFAHPGALFDEAWRTAMAPAAALKWSTEYLTEAERAIASDQLDTATASDLSTNVAMTEPIPDDAELWKNEYMHFVEKLNRGEEEIGATGSTMDDGQTRNEDFWKNLETAWDSVDPNAEAYKWLAEYDDLTSMYKTYNMADENPYLQADDPLAMGKNFLAEGDLANAVLCFEAAVQRQPESADAWLYLARAQAENEQETRAIAAANKCLQLDPANLEALVIVSTAYANESLFDSSCKALAQWLAAHPVYKDFAPADALGVKRRTLISSFMDHSLFKDVEKAFLDAARSTATVDPELQNCLGILYNLSGETNRAVDCFQTALMVRPNDARLWNRLGATLANGGRSAEAVAAYRKALQLYPGFVRARYNLGISCLNLGAHREAIDHILSALSLQMRGVGPSDQQAMSESIWGTLRVAVAGLHRDDWLALVDKRDFTEFKQVFNAAVAADGAGHSSGFDTNSQPEQVFS